MATASDERLWDPGDPAFRADPYPTYHRLRTEAPVYPSPGGPVVATRYDDVVRILRSNDVSRDIEANQRIDENDPIAVRRRQRNTAKTILNLDPPDHTRLRRLVSKAFTPSAVERLRPRIEAMVDERLDVAAERGSIELIDDLAFPVPFLVISELLDMPTDRGDELRDWSQALTATLEFAATMEEFEAADAAIMQLVPYLVDIIESRRSHPGDDVLSALLAVEDAGRHPQPGRADLVRGAAVRRRPRDHGEPHRQRRHRAAAPSRRAPSLAGRSEPRRHGGRRAAALRRSGAADGPRPDGAVRARGDRRRTDRGATRQPAARSARGREPRPGDVRPTRRAATRSPEREPSTCRSAAASTTASAPRWRSSKPASRSRG